MAIGFGITNCYHGKLNANLSNEDCVMIGFHRMTCWHDFPCTYAKDMNARSQTRAIALRRTARTPHSYHPTQLPVYTYEGPNSACVLAQHWYTTWIITDM